MWEVIPLSVNYEQSAKPLWTIRTETEQRISYFGPYFGSCFAVITLRVEPYDGPESVVFLNAAHAEAFVVSTRTSVPKREKPVVKRMVTEEEMPVDEFVAGIVQGLEDALHQRDQQGFPVAGLLIVLTEMMVHEVDSSRHAYRHAATMALCACLETDNLMRLSTES
jgi:translation elongation factor EF-G